ncbi:acyl carrier protein, partial [Frankia canadensis]|uniref:acyl carrier protein n=1 Tax=Frankia canadensis TaxID=1836972 RepID=UPI001055E9EC
MRQTRHSPGRSAHAASTPRAAWRARLTGRSARDQHDLLVDAIVAEIAAVTGQPAGGRAGLDRRAPWRSWGIYRDRAERLRGDLGERIGIRLPATLLFDEPSPDALAEYLRHALLGAGEPGGASARDAARHAGRLEPGGVDDPVVVVGMGCRLA